MTSKPDDESGRSTSPDAAFSALGDETRVEILQALGAADEALAFSDLRDRVGMDDSGQFNYHLSKLVGHFVTRTDDGYKLRRTGERVVEAVLSGAMTETPELEPTRVDHSCEYCGAPVEVSYGAERVAVFCTECPGVYGERADDERGHLGSLSLPPAGVAGRAAEELFRVAHVWGGQATRTAASGVCPRCSAPIDERVTVCEDHDDGDGICGACGGRYAVTVRFSCTNCIYDRGGAFGVTLLTETELLAFLTDRGINPITGFPLEAWRTALSDYEEEVLSVDPLEVRFSFSVEEETLTLTVEDGPSVVEVTKS